MGMPRKYVVSSSSSVFPLFLFVSLFLFLFLLWERGGGAAKGAKAFFLVYDLYLTTGC